MLQITLKAARINAGYTQNEASKKLGIHPQTLLKYEADSSNISFDLINKLVKLYNIPADNIFFGKIVRK